MLPNGLMFPCCRRRVTNNKIHELFAQLIQTEDPTKTIVRMADENGVTRYSVPVKFGIFTVFDTRRLDLLKSRLKLSILRMSRFDDPNEKCRYLEVGARVSDVVLQAATFLGKLVETEDQLHQFKEKMWERAKSKTPPTIHLGSFSFCLLI